MKKIITLVAAVCISVVASAQYFYYPYVNAGTNPGGLNNDNELPLPAGWTIISGAVNTTPAWTANQTIPFAFSFNGAPVTQFKVSTSGILTFDVATALPAPTYTRAALPDAAIPDNSVCIWGLTGIGGNDYVVRKTFGTAPNRQLWIQFSSYGYRSIFSSSTTSLSVDTGTFSATIGTGLTLTVGQYIQFSNGTNFMSGPITSYNASTGALVVHFISKSGTGVFNSWVVTTPSGDYDFTYWSIVLQETTNYIYIVDNRTGGYSGLNQVSAGIQLNSTSAYPIAGSPNLNSVAGTNATPADNTYYTFIQGVQPSWDFTVIAETVQDYFLISAGPVNVTGTLKNLGTQTVTSFTMNYSVNGGPTVSGSIGPVSIAPNATYNFTHPVQFTPPSSNMYSIQMWATDLNGNPDSYTANDNLTCQTGACDLFVPRQTLMEVFTSSTCGPCAPGNANMENNVVPNISNYTVIKYQQDFPGNGDPYRTPEAVSRRGYYNINSIPRMEIDGQWDGNAQSLTTGIYNGYNAMPSFVDIDVTSATYTGTTVNVQGSITPHLNHANTTAYRYHVVVTEKQTVNNWATNGETEFLNVMMNMEPTQTGNAMSTGLVSGTPIAFTKNVTLPYAAPNSNLCCHVEEMSDLRVVVFVQNNLDKKILQSKWMDVLLTGVDEIDMEGTGIAAVYPNPVNNFATIKFQLANSANTIVTITNVMGQVVYQNDLGTVSSGVTKHSLNTENLSDGIYNVTLQANGKLFTHKFVISR